MNAMIDGATALRSPVSSYGLGGYMGDLVAWQLGDFKAPRDVVQEIFERCGFAGALDPRLQDPVAALNEAARTGDKGSGIVVKPFARPNKDTPLAFGVYTRTKANGEIGDEWLCGARVRVEGARVVATSPEGKTELEADKQCLKVAVDIAERANLRLDTTLSGELSNAIVEAGRSCYWASFRKAGGVYWVHADYAPKFRGLLLALEQLGEFLPTLQPLFGDGEGMTMRNIGIAATSAMEQELEDLAADLVKAEDKGMRASTLEARELRCQQLVLRAELYREALAGKAEAIGTRLADIHARFGKLLNVNQDAAFELGDE